MVANRNEPSSVTKPWAGGWGVEGDVKAEGAVGMKAKGDFTAMCSSVGGILFACAHRWEERS